jgi:hypothetical protein
MAFPKSSIVESFAEQTRHNENALDGHIAKFKGQVMGVISGFERLVCGSLRGLVYGKGIRRAAPLY